MIYALLRERAGNPITTLIDINPAKRGRFVPGTGLKVLSPEEGLAAMADGDDICVMNPNYINEIRQMTGGRFNLTGENREQF